MGTLSAYGTRSRKLNEQRPCRTLPSPFKRLRARLFGTGSTLFIDRHAIFSSYRKPLRGMGDSYLARHRQHRARNARKASVVFAFAGQGASPTAAPRSSALPPKEYLSDMLPKKVSS